MFTVVILRSYIALWSVFLQGGSSFDQFHWVRHCTWIQSISGKVSRLHERDKQEVLCMLYRLNVETSGLNLELKSKVLAIGISAHHPPPNHSGAKPPLWTSHLHLCFSGEWEPNPASREELSKQQLLQIICNLHATYLPFCLEKANSVKIWTSNNTFFPQWQTEQVSGWVPPECTRFVSRLGCL